MKKQTLFLVVIFSVLFVSCKDKNVETTPKQTDFHYDGTNMTMKMTNGDGTDGTLKVRLNGWTLEDFKKTSYFAAYREVYHGVSAERCIYGTIQTAQIEIEDMLNYPATLKFNEGLDGYVTADQEKDVFYIRFSFICSNGYGTPTKHTAIISQKEGGINARDIEVFIY